MASAVKSGSTLAGLFRRILGHPREAWARPEGPDQAVPPCHVTVTLRTGGARAALALGALLAGGLFSGPAWAYLCEDAAREWRQLEGVTSRVILQAFIDRHPDCPAAVAPARARLSAPR
jgi:hypothetical protein